MRIINERAKALEVVNNKIMVGSKKDTALLVIKHYNELGEDCVKIRNNILDIFEQDDSEFNRVMNISWIDRYVKNNKHATFNDIEYIPITKLELDKISSVGNLNMEKVLFVMLVCAKYDKKERFKDFWYNEEVVNTGQQMFSELFKMAKISQKKDTQLNILNSIFKKTDMLSLSPRTDKVGFKLNFVSDGVVELKIYNLEYDFVNEYLLWKGLDLCEVCGDVIDKKINIQKYCQPCSKIMFKKNVRKNMKKHRLLKKQ